jgi:hypothetical protein
MEAVKFYVSLSLYFYLFFLPLLTFENEKRTVASRRAVTEIKLRNATFAFLRKGLLHSTAMAESSTALACARRCLENFTLLRQALHRKQ